MAKSISKQDTTRLIRKALKEAFPDMKFSVTSSGSNMHTALSIKWTDGANVTQVSDVVNRFKGVRTDSMTDSTENRFFLMDGELVTFYFDYISCKRLNSDAAIQRAIDQLYRRYKANFEESNEPKPTVQQFKEGNLIATLLKGFAFGDNLQHLIWEVLSKNSDRLKVNHSPTAAKVFITHDTGSANQLHAALNNLASKCKFIQ